MSEYFSDRYINDMMMHITGLALRAAEVKDYHLAQQLYAILFDLQLRQDDTLTKLAERVEAAAPRVETAEQLRDRERLRLVPTLAGELPQWPAAQGQRCVRCGGQAAVILPSGFCQGCAG